MRIKGCIALVTGANRGLGKALVSALVEAGAAKVYAAARDPSKLSADGARVVPLALDTTKPDEIAAAAMKCLGGSIQGKLYPRDDAERQALIEEGYDLDRVLRTDDLVAGDDVFFAATGITDGYLLEGVEYWPDGATTYSTVMRARSGTIRSVKSDHRFEKLERFSAIEYRP